jgi:hypothetical protein
VRGERDQLQSEVTSLQRQIHLKEEEILQLKRSLSAAQGQGLTGHSLGNAAATGGQEPAGKWTQIISGQQVQLIILLPFALALSSLGD